MAHTRIQFDYKYEFYGTDDGWFKSQEDVVPGSVRFVRGLLFYANYSVGGNTYWLPVVEFNDAENIAKFKARLLDSDT